MGLSSALLGSFIGTCMLQSISYTLPSIPFLFEITYRKSFRSDFKWLSDIIDQS